MAAKAPQTKEPVVNLEDHIFYSMFKQAPTALLCIDKNNNCLAINKRASDLLGYTFHKAVPLKQVLPFQQAVIHEIKEGIKSSFTHPKNNWKKAFHLTQGPLLSVAVNVQAIQHEALEIVFLSIEDLSEKIETNKSMSILYELSLKLSSIHGFTDSLKHCIEASLHVSNMDSGAIYLYSNKSKTFELACCHSCQEIKSLQTLDFSKHTDLIKAISRGKPDYNFIEPMKKILGDKLKQENIQSICMLPIFYNKEVSGCLLCSTHRHISLNLIAKQVIEAITSQIGHVIDQHRTAELMLESEVHYKLISENTSDLIAIVSITDDPEYIYVSPSYKNLGYDHDLLLGTSFLSMIHLDDRRSVINVINSLDNQDNKKGSRIEYRLKDTQGQWHYVESTSNFIHENLLIVSRDMTERKQFERTIREVLEFNENILNNLSSGLMVLDTIGRVLKINPAGLEILQISNEDKLLHKHLPTIYPSLTPLTFPNAPRSHARECLYHAENQTTVPIGFSSYPLLDSIGKPSGVITIYRDLSDVKNLQDELKSRDKLATIGEMAAGIAHELKNPLFAISGGLQLLHESKSISDQEDLELLEIMYRETKRVDGLIMQLLTFTRHNVKKRQVDLIKLIGEACVLNKPQAHLKHVALRKRLPKYPCKLMLDKNQIMQVLLNIIVNAIEASPAKEAVEITCRFDKKKQEYIIKVLDRGAGVPQSQRKKIFDLFYSNKRQSSGIGLAVSKKIIIDHGGKIWVEPRKDKGSIFIIALPLVEKDEQHNTHHRR